MLNTNRIANLFDIQKRFIRSTHLERDFADHTALRGYVVTPPAQEGFERVLQGLNPNSGQRAWRVTGDYGTGKSSFALALSPASPLRLRTRCFRAPPSFADVPKPLEPD